MPVHTSAPAPLPAASRLVGSSGRRRAMGANEVEVQRRNASGVAFTVATVGGQTGPRRRLPTRCHLARPGSVVRLIRIALVEPNRVRAGHPDLCTDRLRAVGPAGGSGSAWWLRYPASMRENSPLVPGEAP